MPVSREDRRSPEAPAACRQALVETCTLERHTQTEEVRFWRPTDLPGVELMTAVNCDRLWHVFHETYTFCVIPRIRNHDTDLALVRLYRALATGAGALEQESRFTACIRLLLESCGERRPGAPAADVHPGLRRARDYIHCHYARSIRLDELTAVSGLSRFHLVRSFAHAYGVPPHAYQNGLRIAVMRRLLRSGAPIAEIETGFYDQSHAIRHFKRTFHVTPSQYTSPPPAPLPRFD